MPNRFVSTIVKYPVLCSKIPDVHGIEEHDVRTWKFVYFQKIFRFLLHNTRDVTKGSQILGRRITTGAKKSQQCHNQIFQNGTFASERPQVRTWGRHLTSSLRPCTSRLSLPKWQICLQKYLPIGGKLSITNYLKQNAADYRSHMTIENNLKVEKRYVISKTGTTFTPPQKTLEYA